MNQTPLSDDALDSLLADFFQSELKKPWPAAPATSAAHAAPRTPAAPPAPRVSDSRARYTLAASVAFLLGTCWALSDGFQPGEGTGAPYPGAAVGTVNLNAAGASDPAALRELRKDNAEKGNKANAFDPVKVDPFK
jgi:hypothetical protein